MKTGRPTRGGEGIESGPGPVFGRAYRVAYLIPTRANLPEWLICQGNRRGSCGWAGRRPSRGPPSSSHRRGSRREAPNGYGLAQRQGRGWRLVRGRGGLHVSSSWPGEVEAVDGAHATFASETKAAGVRPGAGRLSASGGGGRVVLASSRSVVYGRGAIGQVAGRERGVRCWRLRGGVT